ncbi:hypothetical protein CQW39_09590 [Streptomyces griseofuscus]|uniref:hypothetical protein n=1 Tax=Streptomyces griseofuscus TaxID=146922 RepID=UPI000F650D1A|nr:hypothetical protein [Streptomyces griseofuscus]RRQ79387.1 hypothetical protein CQW39_09590 [Streptomyces griseofuscus]
MHPERRAERPAPLTRTVTPTAVVPAAEQQLAPAPPPGMRVIGYVRIDGMLYAQYGPEYEPAVPVAPPATPVLDPQAQRTAAKGVFAAGAGVGAYFGMQALQILVDSLVRLLAAAAVVAVVWAVQGSRRPVHEGPTYINNNSGFLAGWKSQNGPRK